MEGFKQVALQEAYKMIKSPAVVATKGENSYDLTPYGWIMPMDYEPVTKVIFSSDPTHQAVANIKRTKEFAVVIPTDAGAKWIEECGSVSDAKADKFKQFGISGEKVENVDVLIPTDKIKGFIEFKLIRTECEGSIELVMGEAVAAWEK